jgi:hypothetical protein
MKTLRERVLASVPFGIYTKDGVDEYAKLAMLIFLLAECAEALKETLPNYSSGKDDYVTAHNRYNEARLAISKLEAHLGDDLPKHPVASNPSDSDCATSKGQDGR